MSTPATERAQPIQSAFGAAMRRARTEEGLSQRALAKRTRLDTETINRVENGANTRIETLTRIRQALPTLVIHTDPIVAAQSEHDAQRVELADLQQRVSLMVQAIQSIEQLQKMQALALRALNDDIHGKSKRNRRR